MKTEFFWQLIEHSWTNAPSANAIRTTAIATKNKKKLIQLGDHGESLILQMQEKLEQNLAMFGKDELSTFIRLFEEKLFRLDRESVMSPMGEISGDSFLYARAFIIGMGREYFENIDLHPADVAPETEAGLLAFAGYKVYEEKFDQPFARNFVHSIESFSNSAEWK